MPPDNEPPSERLAPSTELIKAIHNTQVTKPLPSEPPTNNSDPSSPRSDATIRDALLWGAAFVPFLALALLPRRSQLNKLRGDIHALSRQSSKQSKLALEAITALRSNQEELRQSLAQTSTALTRLEELQAHASSKHGAALHYIHRAIANDIKTSREQEQAERLAVDQVAVQALEEARNHLLASRRTSELLTKRLSVSMADIAAWMERVEYEHGPEGMESHVIDRLRAFAFEMEATPDMPRPLDPQAEVESLTSGEHDGTEASVQGLEASSPATSAQPSETKSQSKPSRHDPDFAQTDSFIIY